jgi:hypothetical protein
MTTTVTMAVQKIFLWEVNPDPTMYWYRVEGVCSAAGETGVIIYDPTDPECGQQQFLRTVAARNIIDLFRILQSDTMFSPPLGSDAKIHSIHVYSRPVFKTSTTGTDQNTLTAIDIHKYPEFNTFFEADSQVFVNFGISTSVVDLQITYPYQPPYPPLPYPPP